MNKKQKILPGIFIMIIVFVGWIIKPAHSENHRWYSGDYAQVVSICESDDILRTIAELYMTKDPVDNKQAEELWFYAVVYVGILEKKGNKLTMPNDLPSISL